MQPAMHQPKLVATPGLTALTLACYAGSAGVGPAAARSL